MLIDKHNKKWIHKMKTLLRIVSIALLLCLCSCNSFAPKTPHDQFAVKVFDAYMSSNFDELIEMILPEDIEKSCWNRKRKPTAKAFYRQMFASQKGKDNFKKIRRTEDESIKPSKILPIESKTLKELDMVTQGYAIEGLSPKKFSMGSNCKITGFTQKFIVPVEFSNGKNGEMLFRAAYSNGKWYLVAGPSLTIGVK